MCILYGRGRNKETVCVACNYWGCFVGFFFVVVARGPAAGQAHEVGFRCKEGGKLPKTQR